MENQVLQILDIVGLTVKCSKAEISPSFGEGMAPTQTAAEALGLLCRIMPAAYIKMGL